MDFVEAVEKLPIDSAAYEATLFALYTLVNINQVIPTHHREEIRRILIQQNDLLEKANKLEGLRQYLAQVAQE